MDLKNSFSQLKLDIMNQKTFIASVLFAGAIGHTGEDRMKWALETAAELIDLTKDDQDGEQLPSAELAALQVTHSKTVDSLGKATQDVQKTKAINKKLEDENKQLKDQAIETGIELEKLSDQLAKQQKEYDLLSNEYGKLQEQLKK